MARGDVTTVILAGGRATRLPGKLDADVGGEPLLARVYRNLRDAAPIAISGASFGTQAGAMLECPTIADRWPGRGPLAGLLSAALQLRTPWIFAVAGDAPRVTPDVLDALIDARAEFDEAVVPEHGERVEPLAALYDRAAIEREAPAVVHEGNASMHALLDRLTVRRVSMPPDYFVNINTAADLGAL